MGRLIPYYRVSTRKQGESGLGLEAQQSCVADFARYGQHEIIATYQEIETGKRADRPELGQGDRPCEASQGDAGHRQVGPPRQERALPQRPDGITGGLRVLR